MILTPYILSISLIAVNQLSAYFLGGSTVTEFVNQFVTSLENTQSTNIFQELFNLIIDQVNGGYNPISYLAVLPTLIALGLIMLLLLYISFQFILRFLNIYFLASIYPFTAIFTLHPKTSSISVNFWRQWTTFLIQQPVFIFGFVIVKQLLDNMFIHGASMEGVVLFLGMLLFLCTINLMAARLWGDAYTALAQNITAGLAAGVVKSAIIDKPLQYGSNLANMSSQQSISGIEKKFLNTDYTSPQTVQPNKPAVKTKNQIEDNRSELNKELSGSGYQVNEQTGGRLDVSGSFVSVPQEDKGMVTLYTNSKDAIADGNDPDNLKPMDLQNLMVQDTSNRKTMNIYNKDIRTFAADNNGHAKEVGLGYRSNDSRVLSNMELGRQVNLQKGIQAVAVKNDISGGDKSITGDNLLKIHTYSEVIKNQNGSSKGI